ncbi:MAG TPA: hypothetical protein VN213_05580 [Solirubrobacteraceae bacterium]|nr:hypothetical protein [Solirubrobacteraceae bacterium]
MSRDDSLAVAVATVAAFAERAGAERVVLVLDRGEDAEPALVECLPGERLEVTEGEASRPVDPDPGVAPAALPQLRPPPASSLQADPETGELAAPLGAVAHLADAVLALARAFGGLTVATADFATRDPAVPLTIAARDGEPVLLAMGGRHFAMPG